MLIILFRHSAFPQIPAGVGRPRWAWVPSLCRWGRPCVGSGPIMGGLPLSGVRSLVGGAAPEWGPRCLWSVLQLRLGPAHLASSHHLPGGPGKTIHPSCPSVSKFSVRRCLCPWCASRGDVSTTRGSLGDLSVCAARTSPPTQAHSETLRPV